MNWRRRPLLSHQTVVNLIAASRTRSGLKVRARPDQAPYPAGIEVTNSEMNRASRPRLSWRLELHDRFSCTSECSFSPLCVSP
jgi:hypothetical protein